MNNLVTVYCEWDIGQHGLVFKTPHVAEAWLRNNAMLKDLAYDADISFDEYYQELVEQCLIGIDDLQLIE